jgi:hypothetical protein
LAAPDQGGPRQACLLAIAAFTLCCGVGPNDIWWFPFPAELDKDDLSGA